MEPLSGIWMVLFLVIGLALIIFWIIQLVSVLNSRKSSTEKAVWVVLFLITYIAALAWWISKGIDKETKKRRKR